MRISRRSFVVSSGAVAAGLAGCLGDGGNGGGNGDGANGDGGGNASDGGQTDGDENSGRFDGWFSDVGNYDGVTDMTGEDQVTVSVGASGNGGNYAFDPPAVRVSESTTVVWRWTGDGGEHNVVAAEGAGVTLMSADDTVGREGNTLNYTFEAPGTYMYYCSVHRGRGMKGAVVVE